MLPSPCPDPLILAMNQKNLNYEIETAVDDAALVKVVVAMNQKNLNYEIETGMSTKRANIAR